MKDTLTIECALQAIAEYTSAKVDLDLSVKEHHDRGGVSAGYHFSIEYDRVARLAAEAEERLGDVIDARVRAIIGGGRDQ